MRAFSLLRSELPSAYMQSHRQNLMDIAEGQTQEEDNIESEDDGEDEDENSEEVFSTEMDPSMMPSVCSTFGDQQSLEDRVCEVSIM